MFHTKILINKDYNNQNNQYQDVNIEIIQHNWLLVDPEKEYT